MNDTSVDLPATWVLLVGLAVVASAWLRALLKPTGVPALVAFLLLGILLSGADAVWGLLTEQARDAFSVLADLGVVALLFRVGLDSHPAALARKLPRAATIWIGNVIGSALLGFTAAHWVLGWDLVPSLITATALTATSVGVSVTAWQEAGALDSDNGQLLLDVAELDDVSAIALMAMLFAVVPMLDVESGGWWRTIGPTVASFALKLVLFLGLCWVFAHWIEHPLMRLAARLEPAPERMLTVVGLGFLIAAFADWLGFSLAIGALFAGLAFSRDPVAVKTERSFQDLHAFVTPFFFIHIGMSVDPTLLVEGLEIGSVLLVAAVLGKLIGAGLPARWSVGTAGATLIGVSLVPRAEIAMIVTYNAQSLGESALPPRAYAGMVFVAAATCIGAPLLLQPLLRRYPQT